MVTRRFADDPLASVSGQFPLGSADFAKPTEISTGSYRSSVWT